ncbi:hypothetical protein OUZ56_012037 [Daphnia magna]|uniref:Uncharacterized protein n=1 Tax=Daphnia magna TaxID=35525 RepID=A0ABQ9Z1V0_9CRUS|nr:hypothetical protein OUZ56_012037 [Daphnia magna]
MRRYCWVQLQYHAQRVIDLQGNSVDETAALYIYVGVDWHPGVVLEGVGFAVEVDEVCVPVAIEVLRELPTFHVDGLVAPLRLGSTWRENRFEGDVAVVAGEIGPRQLGHGEIGPKKRPWRNRTRYLPFGKLSWITVFSVSHGSPGINKEFVFNKELMNNNHQSKLKEH